MSNIKRLILYVLKPYKPSIIELAENLGRLPGVFAGIKLVDKMDASQDR